MCVISKVHVRKLLQINQLQKAIYGRLAVDGTLTMEADSGFKSTSGVSQEAALACWAANQTTGHANLTPLRRFLVSQNAAEALGSLGYHS